MALILLLALTAAWLLIVVFGIALAKAADRPTPGSKDDSGG